VSVFGVVMPAWCVMVRCGILTYFMLCVCGKGVYCVHVGAKGVTWCDVMCPCESL
jgi:hypothetical protein